MINRKAALIVALAIGTMCRAEDKGFCPSSSPVSVPAPKKSSAPESPSSDKKYFGTVTLLAVISDKGYVCSARALRGPSKDFNKKAETAVRVWHFDPARKDGHPVPVVVTVDVNYWTTSGGEIVSDPPLLQSSASTDKAGNKPLP
jgi:TonB family protein